MDSNGLRGYEYSRHDYDDIIDIHIRINSPHYIDIHIGKDYFVLKHKYITYNYHNNKIKIGKTIHDAATFNGYERNTARQLIELSLEIIEYGTIYNSFHVPVLAHRLVSQTQ
ncbi:hypothetical protein AWP60_13110 [Escherichia coli]|nr:hypothetical protein AWP60_13110 [Escherichia coli]